MPRRIKFEAPGNETFGQRMAKLRKAAGYSQRDLAAELGISQRMIAYYERHADHPPSGLLPPLAKVLHVSSDELLGLKPLLRDKKPSDGRLWRRFKQVEGLSPMARKQVVQVIDAFIEREKLRKQSGQESSPHRS